jgi:phosphatidylglycerophosphate synthase
MVSDVLDGYLARRWNVTSAAGYVIDALGDRAISLSLTLIVLVRFGISPVIVWLLVFRDIGIYAVRVLTTNWLARSKRARWMSLTHAIGVRTWLGLFLARDGVRIYARNDVLDTVSFEATQLAIITCSIIFSYYALAKSFQWVIEQEHASV